MAFRSLRGRITAGFSLSMTILMLLVCTGLAWHDRRLTERNADATLKAAAERERMEIVKDQPLEGLSKIVAEEREELRTDNLAMIVVDRDERIVLRSQESVPPWPHPRKEEWRIASFPAGDYLVVLGMPWKATEAVLSRHSLALTFLALFVVLVTSGGAWLLVGRTLSPIASLSHQANAASADHLHIRLTEPSEDVEIVELVATLNGLLTRLSETAAAKGRFYSAASHELRTPLQALLGHLEVGLNKVRSREEYRAIVGEAHRQTRRLASLVRDLLMLYQLDSAKSENAKEPVNPAEVCRRTLSHFQLLIEQRQLRVKTRLAEDAEVLAPPSHFDVLVRNLVENALKFAVTGGEVRVDVGQSPHAVKVVVFNECPVATGSNMQQMSDRLSVSDEFGDPEMGSTGLGLTICRAIAAANGWELTLAQEAGGVVATVVLRSRW